MSKGGKAFAAILAIFVAGAAVVGGISLSKNLLFKGEMPWSKTSSETSSAKSTDKGGSSSSKGGQTSKQDITLQEISIERKTFYF